MMCLAIIVPFYNEASSLLPFRHALTEAIDLLDVDVKMIAVNDGSQDETPFLLDAWALEDTRLEVVHLTRNFGHQAALTAGMDMVSDSADYVVTMDGDLQDPPSLIAAMLEQCEKGADIVCARRLSREGEGPFKRVSAYLFYRVFQCLVDFEVPDDTGDFRLMSYRAFVVLRDMREQHRYLRGMSAWSGFPIAYVDFHRPSRLHGETHYPLSKMLAFGWSAALSFSAKPLRAILLLGVGFTIFGFGYSAYSLVVHYLSKSTVPGWTSIVMLLCILAGVILVALGIIGEYVAKIFEELKNRPLYVRKANETRAPIRSIRSVRDCARTGSSEVLNKQ